MEGHPCLDIKIVESSSQYKITLQWRALATLQYRRARAPLVPLNCGEQLVVVLLLLVAPVAVFLTRWRAQSQVHPTSTSPAYR